MSVIAFCKNETSTPLSICFCALQGDDYACGKKRRWRGKEKPFALFVPKFDKVLCRCQGTTRPGGDPGKGWGGKKEEQHCWKQGRERKGRWPRSPGRGHREGGTSQAMQGCLDILSASFLQLPPSSSYRFLRGSGWDEL